MRKLHFPDGTAKGTVTIPLEDYLTLMNESTVAVHLAQQDKNAMISTFATVEILLELIMEENESLVRSCIHKLNAESDTYELRIIEGRIKAIPK